MRQIQTSKISLDWSRLLIFDQATATAPDPEAALRLTDPRLAKLGNKPTKQGLRIA